MKTLVELLLNARRNCRLIEELPGDLTPTSLDEGYRVAAALAQAGGAPVAGWKVGATSEGAQSFLGVASPIYGRVFEGNIWPSGTQIPINHREVEVEPEIIFRLSDRPAVAGTRGTAPEIMGVHLGLEINRPSFARPFELGVGAIVADHAANFGLIVGPEIAFSNLDREEGIGVQLFVDGELMQTGNSRAVLGHPLKSLEWLAQQQSLQAGQFIATGAMGRAVTAGSNHEVRAVFGRFGEVSVAFTEKTV
jgi:2-keto-4-pentenoate hydratase